MQVKAAFSGYSSNNIESCRQFYGGTLGLVFTEQMGGIGLNCNGQQVFIYPKEDHRAADFTVLNFVVDDINLALDELASKGVVFERYDNLPGAQDERGVLRGKEHGMGPNIAWFKDPSDNILALVEQ